MAKPKKSTKETLKWKKKRWVPIIAPPMLRDAIIGESLVMNPEQLIGKKVLSNLMTLTGDMKKQHISIRCSIDSIKEGRAYTKFESYIISPATIKRNVRRRRDRVDCIFNCTTKDKKDIRVKVILITRGNAVNSVLTALRKSATDMLSKHFSTQDFDVIFKDVLDFRIQSELKKQLKPIYPLISSEVRFIGLKEGRKQ
ncbi:hypothetical protein JXB31_05135 [Candidatus Woesearchaeota archaeon]|nr:hypothetical protein [Candidatus Woesearchaeota archaeon]